jgi:hypothetical protein
LYTFKGKRNCGSMHVKGISVHGWWASTVESSRILSVRLELFGNAHCGLLVSSGSYACFHQTRITHETCNSNRRQRERIEELSQSSLRASLYRKDKEHFYSLVHLEVQLPGAMLAQAFFTERKT